MTSSRHLPRVLLTDPIDAREAARLGESAEVVAFDEAGPLGFTEAIERADFVVVRRGIPEAALPRARRLRALVRHGAGLDFIPVEAASRLGIAVTNTPSVNARSVGEHVFGLVIGLARRIAENDAGIRGGEWQALRAAANATSEITGKTLGLIGYGDIGQAIGQIARNGFGMDVLAVACPLSDETRNLVSREIIAAMQPHAILVNVARGPIVDEAALAAALHAGRLGGAALDVYCEQPLPPESPIRTAPNTILSPHVAGVTAEAMARMSREAVSDILMMIADQRPKNLVNVDAWPQIHARWRSMPDP